MLLRVHVMLLLLLVWLMHGDGWWAVMGLRGAHGWVLRMLRLLLVCRLLRMVLRHGVGVMMWGRLATHV